MHQHSAISVVLAAGAVSLFAGCGASSGITALAGDDTYGASVSLQNGESTQLGSQLLCVRGDQPAAVSGVEFEQVAGVEIVDVVVVTQAAADVRLGSARGPLGTDLPGRTDQLIHGQCADLDPDGNAPDDAPVSYVVLELRLAQGQSVGTAAGLRVDSQVGSAVDPMAIVLCDQDAVTECSPDLAPGRDAP